MRKLLLLFTVPVLPFSLATEYLYARTGVLKDLFVPVLGLLALFLVSLGAPEAGGLLKFLAVVTSLVYTLRLLVVEELLGWVFMYYLSVAPLAWLKPEQMLMYLVAFLFPLSALTFLLLHLKRLAGTAHARAVSGTAEYMPVWSFLTFTALIASLAVAPAYTFFALYNVVASYGLPLALLILLEWVLWNWSGFKLFSAVLFGRPREDFRYEDVGSELAFPIFFLLLVVFILPLF
ncbi:MAG: hypothetical protein GXO03_03175 [Aquificae bacterium]|nr:hypothetical protein [Aquificota bacterium]